MSDDQDEYAPYSDLELVRHDVSANVPERNHFTEALVLDHNAIAPEIDHDAVAPEVNVVFHIILL